MNRSARSLLLAWFALLAVTGVARADRRYFVQSYTPYLAPRGTLELEAWSIARSGQSGSNTAWQNRVEFEYAITDRLTGAAYFNFVQGGEDAAAMRFDGPSLELIYALGAREKIPLDPAVYLEVRENGEELEIEPKLLLAHRQGKMLGALNLIGEYETIHAGEDEGETEKSVILTAGLTREFGAVVAFGVEALYHRELVESEGNPSAIFAGPTINLQTTKLQLALGWHPQLWGDPASDGNLGLEHFPRSEFRMILGTDL